MARSIRDRTRGRPLISGAYRGHFAVTRSLVEGLQAANLPYNYNPKSIRDLAPTVLVLAGIRTLRQAIQLKRNGHIRRLLAGPNVVIFSSDDNSIIASSAVDAIVTPTDWVTDLYLEDNPSLRGRIFAWPAGVDVAYWSPDHGVERSKILVFEKHAKGPVGPIEPYASHLRSLGETVEIIRYGSYSHTEFLYELRRSKLMIGFVKDESQGLAWAEAWATDTPTLLWRNQMNVLRGRTYRCSTAPYLTDRTGLFFDDLEDFKLQFTAWQDARERFRPRDWVVENMSDEVCARALYERAMAC